jgi:radical SAM protein with 4Fe4S-binding SPASM domain
MLKLRSIAVELTARCNQRCIYCYNPWRTAPPAVEADLPTERICRLLDRVLVEAQPDQITLTGGEPFLRADLLEIIDYVNARHIPVAIVSNGGLVDEAAAAGLAKRIVNHVQLTLAGPDPGLHDLHCGTGTFETTVAAVRRLVAAGVPVGGSFLCTRRNYSAARDTYRRMHELGVRRHFAFNRFNPSGNAVKQVLQLLPRRSEVCEALRQADGFAADHAATVDCTMPIPRCAIEEADYPRVRFGRCAVGSPQAEYAVDPQGRLKLCPLQRQTIGSLWESSLEELVARGAAEKFRAAVPAFCRPCPHQGECLGGCGAAAEWVFGRPDELDPFLAQHVMPEFSQRVAASGQETAWVTGLSSAPVPARETPAPQSRVCIDPWFDLVYHALAHLPVAAADASTLMDEEYVRWIGAQFARRAAGGVLPPRMLVADAPLMAAAYDASQQGFLLHAWPLLFDRIDTFLESANVDFRQCTWADGEPGRLAAAMQAAMSPVLLDLFRAALVNEVACGYLAIWQEEVAPRAAAYRELFVAELNRLAADLPALGEVTWMLSYPLGAHGRLLRRTAGTPIIVVGVGGPERNLDERFPLLQGCHEHFVWSAERDLPPAASLATRPGREGFEAFREMEGRALERGLQFFRGSRWEAAYLAWRSR